MLPADLAFTVAGTLAAFAGLILLAWAILADRLVTRGDRRAGVLRRCPRCWYDMRAVEGRRCPECGREAGRERGLRRCRRRWRWAFAAVVVLAVSAATIAYPHSRGGAWHRWLPDTAVILLIPHTSDSQWAAAEIGRRLGFRSGASPINSPGRLSEWQYSLLRDRTSRAWLNQSNPAAGGALGWLLIMTGSVTDAAFERLLGIAGGDDRAAREWAFMSLERSRFGMSDEQLNRAKAAISRSPAQEGFREQLRQNPIRMLDAQRDFRAGETLDQRAARWASAPITPDALIDALDGGSVNELVGLYERFHFPRSMLMDTDESITDAIAVQRFDLHIDDDSLTDCVLLAHNRTWQDRGSNIHYEALFLLQNQGGWRLLCRMDLSNCLVAPPSFQSVEAESGRRWVVVRRDCGSSPDGQYFIEQDMWCRVRAGRLVLEQTVMPRGFTSSRFRQTLEPSEPRVIRRHGRDLAAYDIESDISLAVAGEDGSERLIPIARGRGTFRYPLGVSDARLGLHVPPGPWSGRDCWWAILDDPQILVVHKERLISLAHSDDPDVRAALQAVIDEYLSFMAPTPELTEIQGALDEP